MPGRSVASPLNRHGCFHLPRLLPERTQDTDAGRGHVSVHGMVSALVERQHFVPDADRPGGTRVVIRPNTIAAFPSMIT
jgi:hypothetical protein